MSLEKDYTGILRELIQFLECLREIKLPFTLENLRNNLLMRSRQTLTTFTVIHRSHSPEAYLNMNAGLKGLFIAKPEAELQEYVGAEEPRTEQKHQDYYETFLEAEGPSSASSTSGLLALPEPTVNQEKEPDKSQASDQDKEQEAEGLIQIYSRLTAEQTKSSSIKCGPLCKKEGKKLFFTVFEQYRPYWVGLVGSHLLIYGCDRDNRPYVIQPIRGYMARAAPNALPRDARRSECAFEVFRPGSRTLQFIARTPKDMEQWVAKICQINENGTEESKSNATAKDSGPEHETVRREAQESRGTQNEEQYQDVASGSPGKFHPDETAVKEAEKKSNENVGSREVSSEPTNPPPLPTRIPRRLPSPPRAYRQSEEDEDDIYHRIEDLRGTTFYENVAKSQKAAANKAEIIETYDDVQAAINAKILKIGKPEPKKTGASKKMPTHVPEIEETYDDIGNASKKVNKPSSGEEQDQTVSYDEIASLSQNTEPIKNQTPEKAEELQKTPQKKSFLDRVRSRKESPRKVDKKAKRKTPTPPPPTTEELPMYDDVFTLTNNVDNAQPAQTQNTSKTQEAEELPVYTCPPPPRPVYAPPPVIPEAISTQEIYDDIGSCQEKYKTEESKIKLDQQVIGKPGRNSNHMEDSEAMVNSMEIIEHYQTPRSEACQQNHLHCQDQQEELYDDIAILADFTARQRSTCGRGEFEDGKLAGMPEKKPWNRFVGARRSRPSDSINSEDGNSNGLDEVDELSENQTLIRMNTFQKLISKMENSLGKTSGRTAAPMQLNKASLSNNA